MKALTALSLFPVVIIPVTAVALFNGFAFKAALLLGVMSPFVLIAMPFMLKMLSKLFPFLVKSLATLLKGLAKVIPHLLGFIVDVSLKLFNYFLKKEQVGPKKEGMSLPDPIPQKWSEGYNHKLTKIVQALEEKKYDEIDPKDYADLKQLINSVEPPISKQSHDLAEAGRSPALEELDPSLDPPQKELGIKIKQSN